MKEFKVNAEYDGMRLDRYILKSCRNLPRGAVMKLLRTGKIKLNGKKSSAETRLTEGDIIVVYAQTSDFVPDMITPAPSAIKVLYEDESYLFVDKPAPLKVQPSSKDEDCLTKRVIGYLAELIVSSEGKFIPGTPMRLDTNTTGITVFAKTPRTAAYLAGLSAEGKIDKNYLCLCAGIIPKRFKATDYCKKDASTNKMQLFSSDGEGRAKMVSVFEPLAYFSYENNPTPRLKRLTAIPEGGGGFFTLVKVTLLTGRTHQIRAQLAFRSHPVAGDMKYGDERINRIMKNAFGLNRQFLHANEISFPTSPDGSRIKVSSPLPPELSFVGKIKTD